MALPTNILQNVQTYQKTELARLLNSFYAIRNTNKKFKNFNTSAPSNLGDTVTFDVAPRYIAYNGLVVTSQPSAQRTQSLVCSQAINITSDFSDEQFIFNARDYMDRFGDAAMAEFGSVVERDLLLNIVSGVRINNPKSTAYGQLQSNSGPYRFYGDGVTPINSFGQLAQAIANFNDFGSAKNDLQGVLPTTSIPGIVNTGLAQFATNRNNEMANSWELGRFAECNWYSSNLLPTHTAGTIGDTAAPNNIMTLVSTNDPTGANVTQLTFTEPTSGTDANAVKAGDLFQFNDGVSGKPNLRYLTFTGHSLSQQPVQFRATADAATVAGTITVTVSPALVWAQNANQNLAVPLSAGMKATPLPSHRAGLIHSGNQFYMAMPQLPDTAPFDSVTTMDKESGASIRHYFGTVIGQDQRIYARDGIWGSTLVPDNCMRIIFPM